MVIKVDKVSMQLIELSTLDSDRPKGLYLVPSRISIDVFEEQVKCFDKSQDPQNDFDELNTIGAIRVEAYDCIMDLDNF